MCVYMYMYLYVLAHNYVNISIYIYITLIKLEEHMLLRVSRVYNTIIRQGAFLGAFGPMGCIWLKASVLSIYPIHIYWYIYIYQ